MEDVLHLAVAVAAVAVVVGSVIAVVCLVVNRYSSSPKNRYHQRIHARLIRLN